MACPNYWVLLLSRDSYHFCISLALFAVEGGDADFIMNTPLPTSLYNNKTKCLQWIHSNLVYNKIN